MYLGHCWIRSFAVHHSGYLAFHTMRQPVTWSEMHTNTLSGTDVSTHRPITQIQWNSSHRRGSGLAFSTLLKPKFLLEWNLSSHMVWMCTFLSIILDFSRLYDCIPPSSWIQRLDVVWFAPIPTVLFVLMCAGHRLCCSYMPQYVIGLKCEIYLILLISLTHQLYTYYSFVWTMNGIPRGSEVLSTIPTNCHLHLYLHTGTHLFKLNSYESTQVYIQPLKNTKIINSII